MIIAQQINKFPPLNENKKIRHRVHKGPLLGQILRQMCPVRALTHQPPIYTHRTTYRSYPLRFSH